MPAMTGLEGDVSRQLSVMFTQCPADSLLVLLGAGRAIYFAWVWVGMEWSRKAMVMAAASTLLSTSI